MTTDEPAVGAVRDEVDRPATHPRHRFMSGLWIGLAVHAGAALLFAVLVAVGPDGCDTGYTVAGALLIAIMVDVLAGVITFWQVSRSNPHRRGAVAAGLALSYLAVLVAVALYVAWALSPSNPFGCAL